MIDGLKKIDLHMHTTVSDGTDTPEEIFRKIKSAGISVFSITDHDAVKAGNIIRNCLSEGDPFFIQGAEFSCRDEKGKYHILGYGFDPEHTEIQNLINRGHSLRMKKVAQRLEFLKTDFGIDFPPEEITRLLALDNPGKPHIANLMVKYGYAETLSAAIKDYIDRKKFKSEYIEPEQAIKSITAGGGVAVLAHPFYGSGDELILGIDFEQRIKRLIELGIRGIEAFYSGFSTKLCRDALAIADKYGLYVTAGSDYHGTNKLVRLGETGFDRTPENRKYLKQFLEIFNYEIDLM